MAVYARAPTLASSLEMDVLETLGMKLNPRLPRKDIRTLAGKMKYTYERIRNFEREKNPTLAVLYDWWVEAGKRGEIKTVTELIELLTQMRRDDAVMLLREHEYSTIQVSPPGVYAPTKPPAKTDSLFEGYSVNDVTEPKEKLPQENDYSISYAPNQYSPPGYLPPKTYQQQQNPQNTSVLSPCESSIASSVQYTRLQNFGVSSFPTDPHPQVRHPATEDGTPRQAERNAHSLREQEVRNPGCERTLPNSNYDIIPDVGELQGRPVVTDKVALLIGNKDYECKKLRGLFYPETDTQDVATALLELDFKVVSLINLTLSEMRIAVLAFCRLLGPGVYGVLYYAGHGYEDGGENFLLPVDATLKYKRNESLRAQEILQTMQECNTALNLLIIDSCRITLPGSGNVKCIRRGVNGNNIFAYSCCSQQEAYEEPDQRNGLYASHLLRHLRRNTRIEVILMDVARDLSLSTRMLHQRPCHESDAVCECRLTDTIHPSAQPEEYKERIILWKKAHSLPQSFKVDVNEGLVVYFSFKASFSNVTEIMMTAVNSNPFTLASFVMDLNIPTPVKKELKNVSGEEVPGNGGILKQVIKLSALQKLQDPLEASLSTYYRVDDNIHEPELKVRLGCPLVASVFVTWDWWVTCGRMPAVKCTQV